MECPKDFQLFSRMHRHPKMTWTTGVLMLGLVLGTLRPDAGMAQTPSDVLRGRVVDETGAPLMGARVIATADSTRQTRDTRTGVDGRYTLVFPASIGGYSLTIAAIGRHPVRVSVARAGTTVAPIRDVVLHALALALNAVVVKGRKRQLPQGTNPSQFSPGAGADERGLDADSSGLSPADAGNLNALAGRTPGFSLTPSGGLSALGASANQNTTTLNGLGFTGTKIPLGANVSVSAASSTFDPSRGGFSGGQTALQLSPGSNITNRSLHFSLDAPPFQLTDAASRQLGQPQPQFNGQLSWAGDGPLVLNTANYNVSLEVDHQSSAMPAWGSEGLAALQRIGIAPDSVTRTLSELQTAGVPLAPAHPPGVVSTTSVTTLSQLSLFRGGLQGVQLTLSGDVTNTVGAGFNPTATVGHSGTATDARGSLQVAQDKVIDSVIRNTWQTAFSLHDARTSPYLALPEGNVFLASQFPDSSVGSTTLAFGGAGNGPTEQRDWQWETRNTTSWNSLDNTHTFTLMADATLQGQHLDPGQSYGSYAYNSLADLVANTPASFTRTLDGHATTASVWDGALSFGDDWRPTAALQMQYGVRLDGAHFLSAPAENPLADSLFGVRTDHVPNGLQLSPRVGFTWLYGGSSVGPQLLSSVSGEDRSHGVIRGGIGEFWSTVSPLTVASYMNATGVGGALQQLQCLGAAIPAAAWPLFASDPTAIPTQCLVSGSGGLASTAPSIQLLGPDYAAAHSWRGNLSWTSTVHRAFVEVTGRYSRDITPSSVDLNFQGIPQFTLPAEGNRPVFVPPISIIPSTGAVSDVASRIAPAFDEVTSAQGALQAVTKSVTLSLSPANPFGTGLFGTGLIPHLDYTLMTSAAQSNGFTGAAGSDPRTVEWAPGATFRHTINLQLQKQFRSVTLAFNDYLFSGLPYTPTVGGDILGTGASLDRAFVFDPAHTNDPTLAAGMRALLQTTAGSTRRCLQAQLGRIAGTNSCVGPWNSQMSLSASLDGPTLHLTDRLHLQLYVANPLGGLDQVLHGADHLHGWGALNVPNPVLLQPTGFNATTRQFAYTVNPTFGSPLPQQTVARSPMTVTLGGSITLGMRPDEQQVDQLLAPGRHSHRGARMTAEEIRRQLILGQDWIFNMTLRVRDTLLLTRPQIQEIQGLIREFSARADSVWAPEAAHLAALGDHYDLDAETQQYKAVAKEAQKLVHDFGLRLKHVLTASQWELVPAWLQTYFAQ
jgi:hypothetical protein